MIVIQDKEGKGLDLSAFTITPLISSNTETNLTQSKSIEQLSTNL